MKNSTIHQFEIHNRAIDEFKKYCDGSSDKTDSTKSEKKENKSDKE